MEYQICSRCIMDTSDPLISFDADGHCNHCTAARQRFDAQLLAPAQRQQALEALVEKIRQDGKGKDYDCIVGVSGGVDSTMVACQVRKLGLRPLAVHFDNGWNSELAVDNIHNVLSKLKIELYTYVVDWEEFRDLQLSFLKSSVANCEAPTDHGIHALLFKTASREGLRYILSGSNLATEAILPIAWGHYHQDLRLLRAIHSRFGTQPLKTFPQISVAGYIYYTFVRGIRQIPFLNYSDYHKDNAKKLLIEELGWRDYGGKHYESVWTRFFQGYYLPKKFGYDKRRAHLSSLIISGQMNRETALAEMEKPAYDADLLKQDTEFVIKKFGLTADAFEQILSAPPRQATDYPSNYFLFHRLKKYKNLFRKYATTP